MEEYVYNLPAIEDYWSYDPGYEIRRDRDSGLKRPRIKIVVAVDHIPITVIVTVITSIEVLSINMTSTTAALLLLI